MEEKSNIIEKPLLGSEKSNEMRDYGSCPNWISIVLTIACPLKCRHCSVGSSGSFKQMRKFRWNKDDLATCLNSIKESDYNLVNFVGGEPSIEPELLDFASTKVSELGLGMALTTAPIWARDLDTALSFLSKMSSLQTLILSYDQYHLEQLSYKHYQNATNAAKQLGVFVNFNICYTHENEKALLESQFTDILSNINNIDYQPIIPIGNAKTSTFSISHQATKIDNVQDIYKLPRSCSILKSATIGMFGQLSACCWASAIKESPVNFKIEKAQSYSHTISEMMNDSSVNKLKAHGFLDLMQKQSKKIFDLVRGKQFVNECHICMYLMKSESRLYWDDILSD